MVNSFLNRWGILQYEAAAGMLGYPTTDEIVHADGVGRRQEFQRGAIYVAFQNAIGSAIRNGLIRDKWNTVGAHEPGSLLGYPIQDPVNLPDGQGRMSRFERGVIYWHPSTGAWPVTGPILSQWSAAGYEQSTMGYPIADAVASLGQAMEQQFQYRGIYTPNMAIPIGTTGASVTFGVAQAGQLTPVLIPDGINYSGPDFEYGFRITPSKRMIQTKITLNGPQSPLEFKIAIGLPSGFTAQHAAGVTNIKNSVGDTVLMFGDPIAVNSSQQGVPVQVSVDGSELSYEFGPLGALPVTAISDTVDQYNPLQRIGFETLLVCNANPYDCTRAGPAYFEANKISEEVYGENTPGGDNRKDALRHCVWIAQTTERANQSFAQDVGFAHEIDKPSGAAAAVMDHYNNQTGEHVGLRNEGDMPGVNSTCIQYAADARIVPDPLDPNFDSTNYSKNDLIIIHE